MLPFILFYFTAATVKLRTSSDPEEVVAGRSQLPLLGRTSTDGRWFLWLVCSWRMCVVEQPTNCVRLAAKIVVRVLEVGW